MNAQPESKRRYRTIVADPPWDYPEGFSSQSRSRTWSGPINHAAPLPYGSMTLDEIKALNVQSLAAPDCRLFCWTTNRYLPVTFDVLTAWGFTYKQTLVWHKRDGNMGGSVAPCSVEFLIVATQGQPERLGKAASAMISTAAPKQHSRKPEAFLDLVEQVSPGPYVELFARRARFGWDYFGDQSLETADLAA